jgi:hypothetical protein
VPLDKVTKAELQEIHGIGTAFIAAGCVLVLFVGLGIYAMSNIENWLSWK